MSNSATDKRYILGGIFIVIGLFWILEVLDIIPYYFIREFFSVYGFAFILGVFLLATSRHKVLGTFLTVFGGYYLLDEFIYIPYQVEKLIWPTLLIFLGGFIILRSKKKAFEDFEIDPESMDFFDEVSVFGGGEKIINSNNFKGGKITSIFGGSELNLKNAKVSEGNKLIDVFILFGGTKLLVPNDWSIKNEVTALFGGFSDKRTVDPNIIPDPRKEIVVKGIVLFGGGEIKSF